MNTIDKKNIQRIQYLQRLYELSGGKQLFAIRFTVIGKEFEWTDEIIDEVTEYLKNEGLIEFVSFITVAITHNGIKLIESALSQGEQTKIKSIKNNMANTPKRPLRVFLCYASTDKPAARALYRSLSAYGIDAWFDKEKLLPGHKWREEIPKAVRNSNAVIICLSNNSVNKEGYVQKEIKIALDIADEKPEGTIYLIPIRLEDCIVPDRLNNWQWVDLFFDGKCFNREQYQKLIRSLRTRAEDVGANPPKQSNQLLQESMQNWINYEIIPSFDTLFILRDELDIQVMPREEMAFLYCAYYYRYYESEEWLEENFVFSFDEIPNELSKYSNISSPIFELFPIKTIINWKTGRCVDDYSTNILINIIVLDKDKLEPAFYCNITDKNQQYLELIIFRKSNYKTLVHLGIWDDQQSKDDFLKSIV